MGVRSATNRIQAVAAKAAAESKDIETMLSNKDTGPGRLAIAFCDTLKKNGYLVTQSDELQAFKDATQLLSTDISEENWMKCLRWAFDVKGRLAHPYWHKIVPKKLSTLGKMYNDFWTTINTVTSVKVTAQRRSPYESGK